MGIQFEWRAGDDQGDWQTIAQAGRDPNRRKRRLPRWAWVVLLVVVAGLAAGGYWFLRDRYERARREIAFQIQSVVDLEALALQQQDAERLLEQQDPDAESWFYQQQRRIEICTADAPGSDTSSGPDTVPPWSPRGARDRRARRDRLG